MANIYTKAPRLYVTAPLSGGISISLSGDQAHYLLNVMRRRDGDIIRVFNGKDGEFTGTLSPQSKKNAKLNELHCIKAQPAASHGIHLYFAPIKKDRMAFLIEKAVELGVTDLHPVMSEHTENRKAKWDKTSAHIIEAAEQCERMDIPTLHPVIDLKKAVFVHPTFAAIERQDNLPPLTVEPQEKVGLLVGPEGGWSDSEISLLQNIDEITPVDLGDTILRAETAAIYMLSKLR